MFNCNGCGLPSRPGQKLSRRVTVIREVIYTHSGREHSTGFETVKESNLCPTCVRFFDLSNCLPDMAMIEPLDDSASASVPVPVKFVRNPLQSRRSKETQLMTPRSYANIA